MPQTVYFAPLGSKHARAVARLQRKLFARELTEPAEYIRQILVNTEEFMLCNLSFGLFDGTKLVGYAFMYVESESLFHEREEEVIYVKEVALTPGYENWLRPLTLKIVGQSAAYCPNKAIEAHAVDDALSGWKRLSRLYRYLGMTMSVREEERREGRPPYNLIRFDFASHAEFVPEQSRPLPPPGWQFRDDVTVTVLQDTRHWLALREEWDTLLEATPDSNVFQSFDYLWQWWKYFGFWNDLRVLVFRRGDAVIGVAPLMIERFRLFGKVVRKLMFMTAPMEMSRPKLLFGRDTDLCLPALLAYLDATADSWDILDVDEQLDDGSAEAIRAHFRRRGCLVADSETLCPYIDIQGSWAQFMSARPKKLRSNINRLRRKLEASGEVNVRKVASWPELDAALDTHCEIEERSWKGETNLHISANKSHYYFYKGLARSFGATDSLELRLLQCDGKPIASTFGLVRDKVFQSLKIAHDGAHDKLSPGTVLESFELEALFGQGTRRYEFMGSFLSNKLRWTSTVFETRNIHVYQRQVRLMLHFFLFFVFKRRVKTVLKRTGQFERVDSFLGKFRNNPFRRY